MRVILFACLITFPLHGEDVSDIVRAYSERNASQLNRTRNYTYQIRSEERVYDRAGKLKSRNVKTLEYVYQSRGLSVKVTGKNGKPVSRKRRSKINRRSNVAWSTPARQPEDSFWRGIAFNLRQSSS